MMYDIGILRTFLLPPPHTFASLRNIPCYFFFQKTEVNIVGISACDVMSLPSFVKNI
jgi:hypothetical protein